MPLRLVVWALAALVQMLGPLAIAWWFARRYRVGLVPFLYGAGVFLIFQMLTRIPAVQVLGQLLTPYLRGYLGRQVIWFIFLVFTAGLFESVGRWVGYRYLADRGLERDWRHGVAYGIGHGGIESAALVGLSQATSWALVSAVWLLGAERLSGLLPAELLAQLMRATEQVMALPWYATAWGALERMLTIPFHVAMSLVVLEGFLRGQRRWLWIAVGVHALVDFVVAGSLHLLRWPIWASELLLAGVTVASLVLIVRWGQRGGDMGRGARTT